MKSTNKFKANMKQLKNIYIKLKYLKIKMHKVSRKISINKILLLMRLNLFLNLKKWFKNNAL
jgi:hypothetical protein